MIVSKAKMAIVPSEERSQYLRDFIWKISSTDGVVTAHKFLEYINKRTGRSIQFKPTLQSVLTMISILIAIPLVVYVLFKFCKKFINNPVVWTFGSIVYFCIIDHLYSLHRRTYLQHSSRHSVLYLKCKRRTSVENRFEQVIAWSRRSFYVPCHYFRWTQYCTLCLY